MRSIAVLLGLSLGATMSCRRPGALHLGEAPRADGGTVISGPDSGTPNPDAGTIADANDAGPACPSPPPETVLSSSPAVLASDARDDHGWQYEYPALHGHVVSDAWGASPDDLWAIFDRTSIGHWDGHGWTIAAPIPNADLAQIWGSAANDIWVVDRNSTALHHFDGTAWTDVPAGIAGWHMEGVGRSQLFVMATDQVRYFDGATWTILPPLGRGIEGAKALAKDDLWVLVDVFDVTSQRSVGTELRHWDGQTWSTHRSWGEWPAWAQFAKGDGVWLASSDLGLQRWDGNSWRPWAASQPMSSDMRFVAAGDTVWQIPQQGGTLVRVEGACWSQVRSLAPAEGSYETGVAGRDWISVVGSAGTVLTRTRDGWNDHTVGVHAFLSAIGGTSDDDLWAVGEGGTVLHRTSAGWAPFESGTTANLSFVEARAPDDVWFGTADTAAHQPFLFHFDGSSLKAVEVPAATGWLTWQRDGNGKGPWLLSSSGVAWLYDGSSWSSLFSPSSTTTTALWWSGPADAWRAGWYWAFIDGDRYQQPWLERWDGSAWARQPPIGMVNQLRGSSSDSVWAATSGGVWHWDGTAWSQLSTGNTADLVSIAPDDVWARVQVPGYWSWTLDHWDGASWTKHDGPLTALFVTPERHVWTAGYGGAIAHLRDNP